MVAGRTLNVLATSLMDRSGEARSNTIGHNSRTNRHLFFHDNIPKPTYLLDFHLDAIAIF
jgi:hypothetical protein